MYFCLKIIQNTNTMAFKIPIYTLFFLIIFSSCTPSSDINISCDVEMINNKGKIIANNDSTFVFGNKEKRTTKEAYSGDHSIMLTKDNPYGCSHRFKNLRKDTYLKISVWRKSISGEGVIVADAKKKNGERYYVTSKSVSYRDRDGWGQIILHLNIPPDFDKQEFSIYLWKANGDTVYFDDFKIEQLSERRFPDFANKDIEPLNIFIDTIQMQKLYSVRERAFNNGVYESIDDDWVKGMAFYKGNMMKIETRLKGDWLDHMRGKKWSFRIKLKNNESFNRQRVFSIQNPITRDLLSEWTSHQLFAQEDQLTTRYTFLPVKINNKSRGIYACEEHFAKQLIEYNKRREGPILKLTDDTYWRLKKIYKKDKQYFNLPEYNAAQITSFGLDKLLKDPLMKKEFIIGQNLYYSYIHGNKPTSKIFNTDKIAKYFALLDLTKTYHGTVWFNMRFYYNPVISRLEPIGYDGYTDGGAWDNYKRPIFGFVRYGDNITKKNELDCTLYRLFDDKIFLDKYISYLQKYSSEDFINSFMKSVNKDQQYYENILKEEFPEYNYDYNYLKNNAKAIRAELPKFIKYVNNNPDFAKFAFDVVGHKNNYSQGFHREIPELYVNAYLEKENKKDNTSQIKIENYYTRKIHILGTGNKETKITNYQYPSPTLESFNKIFGKPSYIKSDTLAKYLFFVVEGEQETFTSVIQQYPSPKGTIPEDSLIALHEFENAKYLNIKGKNIVFTGKNIVIDTSLIIPAGYDVTIPAGTHIDIINNANILSYSTMHINGTKNSRVIISSSDKTAKGFYLLQAPQKSNYNYVDFSYLGSLDYSGWTLPGSVCVYESEIDMDNVSFSNNQNCDDALNTIRSKVKVSNCSFSHTFADAFDSDFCTGNVDNCTFDKVGNDAIDFSGSEISIKNSHIMSANDKGISGGEESTLNVENTIIEHCNIGIASKDLSNVCVVKSQINNCAYAFVALRKKPEYGGAEIMARRMQLKNNTTVHLIEEQSRLVLGTQIVIGQEQNVAERFY